MLTNSIMLIISGHDTLRPLDMWFRLFTNSIHDTKYYKRCSEVDIPPIDTIFNLAYDMLNNGNFEVAEAGQGYSPTSLS